MTTRRHRMCPRRSPNATFLLATGAAACTAFVAAVMVSCEGAPRARTPRAKPTAARTAPPPVAAEKAPAPAAGPAAPTARVVAVTPPATAAAPPRPNLMKNGSFEGTHTYWVKEGAHEIQRGDAAHGEYCVYFPDKVKLRSGSIRIEPNTTVTVSIHAKGGGASNVGVTLVPSNRQVAQATGTVWCKSPKFGGSAKTSPEWKRYTWTHHIPSIDEKKGTFLGATTRWWNRTSFIIMLGGRGPLWVDALSVVVGEDTPEYAPHSQIEVTASTDAVSRARYPTDACLLKQDETIDVTAHAFNPGDAPREVTLRWELLNYDGTLRFGAPVDERVTIAPKRTVEVTKGVKLTGRGLMLARVSALAIDDSVLGSSDQPLTALAFPKSATKPEMRERFGGSLRGGPLVKAAQQIGLGWTRWFPHFNWTRVQKEGPDAWNWPDETAKLLHDHGISMTAVIHGQPKWAKGGNRWLPSDMEGWAKDDTRWKDLSVETSWDRFVKRLIGRYGHDGIVYEFANEPEIGNHKWDKDVYYNLAQRTYSLIKKLDPGATVQVNETWPGIHGWTEAFVKRGGLKAFDVHTFHNYGEGQCATSDSIRTMRTYFKAMGGGHKEIWFNEGWTYVPTSVDYPAPPLTNRTTPGVGDLIVRNAVDLFSAGMEKLITFHIGYAQHGKSWWDWVGSGTEWWDDHGNPTIAVGAYNVLCHHLGLSSYVREIKPKDAIFHVFQDERNDKGVAIAWSHAGTTVALPLENATVTDIMGNALPATGGTLDLAIGGKPVYVYVDGMSGKNLAAALKPLHAEIESGDGVWVPPKTALGGKVGTSEGNPVIADGRPLWQFDQVWPYRTNEIANYKPLTWNGKDWIATTHSHGGQPAAGVNNGTAYIVCRSSWGGNPGNKLAALSFLAPQSGEYEVTIDKIYLGMWDGGPPAYLDAIAFGVGGAGSKVHTYTLTQKKKDNPAGSFKVRLAQGDRLAFVGRFRGMHTASHFQLKGLVIRLEK